MHANALAAVEPIIPSQLNPEAMHDTIQNMVELVIPSHLEHMGTSTAKHGLCQCAKLGQDCWHN